MPFLVYSDTEEAGGSILPVAIIKITKKLKIGSKKLREDSNNRSSE